MRYCGSKRKYVKDIIPIIMKTANENTLFIDAFSGGANVISEVPLRNKIGIDANRYVISLWNDIKNNGVNSSCISCDASKEKYDDIKQSYLNNDGKYADGLIGYVGNCCSYGGSWFNGYAKYNERKKENHILEAYNGIIKQINSFKFLSTTKFVCSNYYDLENFVHDKRNTIIYCDPPYASTKKYESDFDNISFWEWVRQKSKDGYTIYVSEYSAPSDFSCIWEKIKRDGMPNHKIGDKQKNKIEKLFVYSKK